MSESIRRCTPDDAAALAAIYDPIVAGTTISFEETPPGTEGMRARIAEAGDRFPWLVFVHDERIVGYVYAAPHQARAAYRWSVNVSVYVDATARRLGVARRLYAELFRTLAAQGYCAAFAAVTLPNDPSCRLHESVGFAPVGTFRAVGYKGGAWHDVRWFERRLREHDGPPSEPRALAEI